MLKKEDVEGWNKVFIDCQIKQGDLTQPTESFLVRALVCYLRRFGYKVEPPFPLHADPVDNTRENRLFLLSLVRQIEHFLKITDKSYTFNYYDLIRPTPKKTAHTLYILLNYLFYFNMYKEEVFKLAIDSIRKFQDMKVAIDSLRRNNEAKQQETLELRVALESMEAELYMMQTESKELYRRMKSHEETKTKLNEQCEKLEKSVKHLQEQKRNLSRNIVSDDEARELNKQIEYLKMEFEKFKLNEGSSVDKLRELEDNVTVLQKCILKVEKASENIPKRLLEQLRDTNKQVEEMVRANDHAEQRKAVLLLDIEEANQNHRLLMDTYVKEKEEFQLKQRIQMKSLEALKNELEHEDNRGIVLQRREKELDAQLSEQKETSMYLKNCITEILAVYLS